jgi:hypothetical protein
LEKARKRMTDDEINAVRKECRGLVSSSPSRKAKVSKITEES